MVFAMIRKDEMNKVKDDSDSTPSYNAATTFVKFEQVWSVIME